MTKIIDFIFDRIDDSDLKTQKYLDTLYNLRKYNEINEKQIQNIKKILEKFKDIGNKEFEYEPSNMILNSIKYYKNDNTEMKELTEFFFNIINYKDNKITYDLIVINFYTDIVYYLVQNNNFNYMNFIEKLYNMSKESKIENWNFKKILDKLLLCNTYFNYNNNDIKIIINKLQKRLDLYSYHSCFFYFYYNNNSLCLDEFADLNDFLKKTELNESMYNQQSNTKEKKKSGFFHKIFNFFKSIFDLIMWPFRLIKKWFI